MEVGVLGPVVVWDSDGRAVPLSRTRVRKTLAALAAAYPSGVSADRLIDVLWPDALPGNPAGALRTLISRLRAALVRASGPRNPKLLGRSLLVFDPPSYRLEVPRSQLDKCRFEDMVNSALASSHYAEMSRSLDEAVALWRGEPFGEFSREPSIYSEVTRLIELRYQAMEAKASAELALGNASQAVGWLRALLTEYPHREILWEYLMVALYRTGRQAEALAAYQEARRFLADQLGIEPGRRLAKVEEAILLQDPALERRLPDERPELPVALPKAEQLIGRNQELAAVEKLMQGSQIVTITGPPGVGKSAVAKRVARDVASRYEDGVWYIQLDDKRPAVEAIAAVLPIPTQTTDATRALTDFLATRRALLVIDGFESTVAECAATAGALLRSCPRISLLCASQVRLGMDEESVFGLPPLSVEPGRDDALSAAAELFIRRVSADSAVPASEDRWLEVAELVAARLSGLPLAIELAAARGRTLGPAGLLEDLSLALDVAVDAGATRHATMSAALRWSWHQLTPDQQMALAALSVFTGTWTIDDAHSILGGDRKVALASIVGLIDRSLVAVSSLDRSSYHLLAVIREFAAHQLESSGHAHEVRTMFAQRMLTLADTARAFMFTSDYSIGADLIEERASDFETALAWALVNSPSAALAIATSLGYTSIRRLEHHVGARRLQAALAAAPEPTPQRARALMVASICAIEQRDLGPENVSFAHPFARWNQPQRLDPEGLRMAELGLAWAAESVELSLELGMEADAAISRVSLAVALATAGRIDDAVKEGEAGLAVLGPEVGYWPTTAATIEVANIHLAAGNDERAHTWAVRGQVLAREAQDSNLVVWASDTLGRLARARGDLQTAVEAYSHALAHHEQYRWVGPGAAAILQKELGYLYLSLSALQEAAESFSNALRRFRETGSRRGEAGTRAGQALVAARTNNSSRATELLDEAISIARRADDPHLVAFATACLGLVQLGLADHAAAEACAWRALDLLLPAAREPVTVALSLETLALVRAAVGRYEEVAELLGAAESCRTVVRATRPAWIDIRDAENRAVMALGPERYARLCGRGSALDPVEAALLGHGG